MSRVGAIPVRRRGVWLFAMFAAGVCCAWWLRDAVELRSAWLIAIGVACGLLGVILRGAVVRLLFGIGVGCLGGAVLIGQVLEAPGDDLRWVLPDEPRLLSIEGTIVNAPRVMLAQRGGLAEAARYNPEITRLRVRAMATSDDAGTATPASGVLYVRVDEPMAVWPDPEALEVGDRVRMTGLATGLRGPTNPGEHDVRHRAHQRDIAGSMRVARGALIEKLPEEPGVLAQIWRWRDRVRARALASLGRETDAEAVLAAVLLGERDPTEGFEVESAFRRVGVAHVLAISGLHVGMVVVMVVIGVRLLGDHARLQWVAALAVVGAMALLIPARAPILRAVLIVASVVIADMAGRRYDRLNMLALAAGAILVFRPLDLFDPGYQLSFGVVAGLIWLGPSVRDRWLASSGVGVFHTPWRWVNDAVITSAIAWSIATPIAAYHFGLVSPMAVMSSVIAAPLVALALAFGYVGLGLLSVAPGLGELVLSLATTMSDWLLRVVMALDDWPGIAVRVPTIGVVEAVLALAAVVAWWRVLSRAIIAPMNIDLARRQLWTTGLVAATLGLAAWIGGGWWTSARLPEDVVLRIDTLDVGDGSCHLIRSGRASMLFDCGSNWYAIGQREIPNALRALGATHVQSIMISHADIDHFSGVLDASALIGLREIVVTRQFLDAAAQDDLAPDAALLLERLEERGVAVRTITAGEQFVLGEVLIDVLHPREDDVFERDNAASIVLDLRVPTDDGDRRLLFFGDLDGAGLEAFRSRHDLAGAQPDLIEAPHHGSARASSIEFVSALGPRVVVQSTGPSRADDERWDDVRQGCAWWCTARDGAISARVLQNGRVVVEPLRAGSRTDGPVDGGHGRP